MSRLAWFLCMLGCSGTATNVAERSFARPEAAEVPLQTLDVFVWSGVPVAQEGLLSVWSPDAPMANLPVGLDRPAERVGTEALRRALQTALQSRGFVVRFPKQTKTEALPVVPLSPPSTSTLTVNATISAPVVSVEPALPEGTLAELAAKSTADALLVVRVAPVDTFSIFEMMTPTTVLDPELNRVVRQDSAIRHDGRLLVGQIFLFERQSTHRLWSRQRLDFPDAGRLTPDHPFLRSGYVAPRGSTPDLPTRARLAAEAFVAQGLRDFPKANVGSEAARARLLTIDTETEAAEQRFYDQQRWSVELAGAWALERAGADVLIDDVVVDSVGSGAVAPAGVLRGQANLGFLFAGGFTLRGGIVLGRGLQRFSRAYHQDGDDGLDRSFVLTLPGASVFGANAAAGYTWWLSSRWSVAGTAGLFLESWSLRATPENTVLEPQRLRLGLIGHADLIHTWTPRFFSRSGLTFRAGADTGQGSALSGEVSLGAGLFF